MNAADKTKALIAIAEALNDATLVGHPAPIVAKLRRWMDQTPNVRDLVLEMSTKHRGLVPSRIGIVEDVSGDQVTVGVLDPPCGDESECRDLTCIHRYNWTNASFIRLPLSRDQD